ELLRRAQHSLANLMASAEQLEKNAEDAKDQLQRLQQSLRLVEDEREKARMEAAREIQRARDLGTALEQTKSDSENERKRLAQQIGANAAGRIEEFKNKLGLTLSRLVIDLPNKGSVVNAELGKVLLLQ